MSDNFIYTQLNTSVRRRKLILLKNLKTVLLIFHVGVLIRKPSMGTSLKET